MHALSHAGGSFGGPPGSRSVIRPAACFRSLLNISGNGTPGGSSAASRCQLLTRVAWKASPRTVVSKGCASEVGQERLVGNRIQLSDRSTDRRLRDVTVYQAAPYRQTRASLCFLFTWGVRLRDTENYVLHSSKYCSPRASQRVSLRLSFTSDIRFLRNTFRVFWSFLTFQSRALDQKQNSIQDKSLVSQRRIDTFLYAACKTSNARLNIERNIKLEVTLSPFGPSQFCPKSREKRRSVKNSR